MKQFKIYIGQNNETQKRINLNILNQLIKNKYKEIEGFTIYKGLGFWRGQSKLYEEKTINLEIVTDNLNYIYIEELCDTLKRVFNQESIFYTEQSLKGGLI